ncbi:hypothetical protein QBL07_024250 (plasmid) [Gordonia rubripertincta]|uniref:DUF3800 domain-containing protein n=2 Tax=Gordonia rubripertincta TaxID=36822 RepID=A0AAW6REY5_GORRU|nr:MULTISPECIES: hypothetical protein [Gordonia]MDG6783086.1 hypothetical protein [Gordonia rubripertincta]NKY65412.1 hypothetical protein [Gordonia rubripertincta]GAB86844.1 hypothetical protein GORBP_082_00130 [Gordonia rubripertincta NBRC 101908]
MLARRIYVDETKQQGFVLVAGVVVASDQDDIRRTLRELTKPGQNRIHMRNENDARKRQIADAVGRMPVTAWVYKSSDRGCAEKDARAACMRRVVEDAVAEGIDHLVIEQDDSMVGWDSQALIDATRDLGVRETFRWEHNRARTETLLSVPDVIAWCYGKSGYHSRIAPLVAKEVPVLTAPTLGRRPRRR